MVLNEESCKQIKIDELPKEVIALNNRPFIIAVPNELILTLLECKINYSSALKRLNSSLMLLKITFRSSALKSLSKKVSEYSNGVCFHMTSLFNILNSIYAEYVTSTVQVINIDGIENIKKIALKDLKTYEGLFKKMYDKTPEWKDVKHIGTEDVLSLNKLTQNVKKEGKIATKYNYKVAMCVISPVIKAAKIVTCCEKQLKLGRGVVIENIDISETMVKLDTAKSELKFIKQYCVEGQDNPKFKKYHSSLQKILDKISSCDGNSILKKVNNAKKSVKYSVGNVKNIYNLKSHLRTIVSRANMVLDKMKDPKCSDDGKDTSITKFKSSFESIEKTMSERIKDIQDVTSPDIEAPLDLLQKAAINLEKFLNNNIIKSLENIKEESDKNKIILWICSNAKYILIALGFIVSLL